MIKKDKPKLSQNIQKFRLEQNLTQEQLAIKAGIPFATLSKIESGQVDNPTIKTLQKIAGALGVSVDKLLN